MKFLFPISVLALFGAAAASVNPLKFDKINAKKMKLERDFMQAIHADGKIASAQRKKREQARRRKLYERLVEAAVPKSEHDKKMRKLDQEYYYNNGDNYEWMNPVYEQMVEDGVFDLTARSFKYSGCAAIKAFDPENAGDDGVPMSVDTYAVFRLCPEDSCNKYSLTGCGKNYGEYVVSMSTYLEFMLEFYEDHYGAYCDYCYACDYNYQVQKKQMQSMCYENMNKADYDMNQYQQQEAWENYYQQNYGDMSEYTQQKQQYQQQMQQQMNNANQQGASNYYQQYGNGNSNNYNGGNRKLDGYYSSFAGTYNNILLLWLQLF